MTYFLIWLFAPSTESISDLHFFRRSKDILLTRQQHPYPHGDDREQVARARQAAEALFIAKSPEAGPTVPDPHYRRPARASRGCCK